MLGVGQGRTEARPRRHAEQLAPFDEVRREEDGEHDLGELARLEVDRADVRPDASTVDLAADDRRERRHQQQQAEQEERVAVALQIARPADDDQRGDERADADDRPAGLGGGQSLRVAARLVETGDHHVADAVQERGDRQQQAVRARGQLARGDVRGDEQTRG